MKIKKFVQFDKEIEIDIDSEDIQTVFDSDDNSLPHILYHMNDVATFLKGISDQKILDLGSERKKAVAAFLLSQAERYKETL